MFAFCVYTPHEFRIDWFLVYSLLTVQFSKSFLGCRFKRRLISYHRGKMFVNNFFWRSFSWRCVSRTACLVYLSEPWLSTPFLLFSRFFFGCRQKALFYGNHCLLDLPSSSIKNAGCCTLGRLHPAFYAYCACLCFFWSENIRETKPTATARP